jgi:hypothetical protein
MLPLACCYPSSSHTSDAPSSSSSPYLRPIVVILSVAAVVTAVHDLTVRQRPQSSPSVIKWDLDSFPYHLFRIRPSGMGPSSDYKHGLFAHSGIKKGSVFPVKISRLIEVNPPSADLNDAALNEYHDRVAEMLSGWSRDGYYVVELRMDWLLPKDKISMCTETLVPELVTFKEAGKRVPLAPPDKLTFALFTAEDSPFHIANDAAYSPDCMESIYSTRDMHVKNHAEFIPCIDLNGKMSKLYLHVFNDIPAGMETGVAYGFAYRDALRSGQSDPSSLVVSAAARQIWGLSCLHYYDPTRPCSIGLGCSWCQNK